MLFQQPVHTGSNFTIPFDGTIEKFTSTFPISLVNRVHPDQFQSTLEKCNLVMKKHMDKIKESDKKVLWVILAFIGLMILLILFPTLFVTVIVPVGDSDAWIPAVFIPIFACIPMIGIIIYSSRRMQQIKAMHVECKKEVEELLAQENSMYFQFGVQWILRYDGIEAIGKVRYGVYRHLNTMPSLEILTNQAMYMVQQPNVMVQGSSDMMPMYQQQQAIYVVPPTSQPQQPTVYEQEPHSVTYQQVNQYQKENDNQPLLGNRV